MTFGSFMPGSSWCRRSCGRPCPTCPTATPAASHAGLRHLHSAISTSSSKGRIYIRTRGTAAHLPRVALEPEDDEDERDEEVEEVEQDDVRVRGGLEAAVRRGRDLEPRGREEDREREAGDDEQEVQRRQCVHEDLGDLRER